MCSTRSAMGTSGKGSFAPTGTRSPAAPRARTPGQPDVELGLKLVERGGRAAGILPGTDLHGRRRAAARLHAPGVRHRRPEVLVVGEAIEPGSELMVPVELPLLAQRAVPVEF